MTRSVHTDPLDIRAARRLADPDTTRGLDDHRNRRRSARRAKLNGTTHSARPRAYSRPASKVRIIEYAPGAGYIHPAGRVAVRRLLDLLPPRYLYKLHSIELRPTPPGPREARPLGRLLPPGRVILYAQPGSPWMLRGIPADHEQARLRQAGALVSVDHRSCLTIVTWPEGRLCDFMLQDVLLHELAHHVLQVRRAKSMPGIVRLSDHEAVARGMSRRQAERLGSQSRECA